MGGSFPEICGKSSHTGRPLEPHTLQLSSDAHEICWSNMKSWRSVGSHHSAVSSLQAICFPVRSVTRSQSSPLLACIA
jgi:hypothetical protein